MLVEPILYSLEKAPVILNELLQSIPTDMYHLYNEPGKWCIHQHACHIIALQPRMTLRLINSLNKDFPSSEPVVPGKNPTSEELLEMDLNNLLEQFPHTRIEFVDILRNLKGNDWNRRVEHPKFTYYTPYIMARRIMFHDNFHMYRIEDIWITGDSAQK